MIIEREAVASEAEYLIRPKAAMPRPMQVGHNGHGLKHDDHAMDGCLACTRSRKVSASAIGLATATALLLPYPWFMYWVGP